ncbi:hypothetical protein FQB35_10300 [Crassaminicella thermophila]|uniref:Uncharacterized protein n=1 Tax=Crassaminicella thermophila TaxID=2599308 RepID=A0A5C0SIC4_CRATE|nr:hypothetical protein [Crassaminicella thermophila]QEK12689.1 hypothetical protein FQB35_10300 [Crassaminicella thermophila]
MPINTAVPTVQKATSFALVKVKTTALPAALKEVSITGKNILSAKKYSANRNTKIPSGAAQKLNTSLFLNMVLLI